MMYMIPAGSFNNQANASYWLSPHANSMLNVGDHRFGMVQTHYSGKLGEPGNQVWDPTKNQLVPECRDTAGGKIQKHVIEPASASPKWANASAQPFVPSALAPAVSGLNSSAEPFAMPATKTATDARDAQKGGGVRLICQVAPRRMFGTKLRNPVTAKSTISALNIETARRIERRKSPRPIQTSLEKSENCGMLQHDTESRSSEASSIVSQQQQSGGAEEGQRNGDAFGTARLDEFKEHESSTKSASNKADEEGAVKQSTADSTCMEKTLTTALSKTRKEIKQCLEPWEEAVSQATDDVAMLDVEGNLERATCTPSASEIDDENDGDGSSRDVDESEDGRRADAERVIGVRALLAWRRVPQESPPDAIGRLCARDHSKGWRSLDGCDPRTVSEDRALLSVSATNSRDRGYRGGGVADRVLRESAASVMTPSSTAFKRLGPNDSVDRDTELKRCVQSLLNKICPENAAAIARRIKSEANVCSLKELELVIVLIFKKALAEPHYCETYADLVFSLKNEMPEFPSSDGGKPVTFKSLLLNVCQNEFESMPRTFSPVSDVLDVERHALHQLQQKKRFLANMKFIGNLFLRQLLSTKVISSIMSDLMLFDSAKAPEEPIIECVCELLGSIGLTLEASSSGHVAVTQVCGRLLELKCEKSNDGKSLYSKRVQFVIQDLLDTRSAGWAMKCFKSAAKTKLEVRQEHEKALQDVSAGKAVSGADFVVVGQRPAYLNDESKSLRPDETCEATWQEISKSRKR